MLANLVKLPRVTTTLSARKSIQRGQEASARDNRRQIVRMLGRPGLVTTRPYTISTN